MRQFTAEYLDVTRTGMWDDSRDALADLDLESRDRILDVGAGTGELTRVLREETPGDVVALDADADLLAERTGLCVVGDALRLPFPDDTFDLAVCQALLVNLPDPEQALGEFARVSSDCVAAVEPDNSAVRIESTVDDEPALARRARDLYLTAIGTDAALGDASDLFERAGLDGLCVRRYDHARTTEPPYSEQALEATRRKASGEGLDSDRETILSGDTTAEEFDQLRQEWRAMGRRAIEQVQEGTYRHREIVPFYVTVGRV